MADILKRVTIFMLIVNTVETESDRYLLSINSEVTDTYHLYCGPRISLHFQFIVSAISYTSREL